MSRPLRLQFSGALYHVRYLSTSKANRGTQRFEYPNLLILFSSIHGHFRSFLLC